MNARRFRAVLLALLLSVAPAAPAAGMGYPVELASRMMELMWDAMLWFFTGVERPSVPGAWGGGMPGGLHGAWSGGMPGIGGPAAAWGGWNLPVAGLDGFWIGATGERLTVQRGRFAYEARGQRLDGQLFLEGERMLVSNPAVGLNQVFAYRRQGDRLLVAAPDGRLFAFLRWSPRAGGYGHAYP